jgi:hypothetical protein
MKSLGKELEELQRLLICKDAAGEADAKLFLEVCLDYQKAKVLRLPNILMGIPPPNVSGKEAVVKNTAKELLDKYPDLPQGFLTHVLSEPELVLKALNEIMWLNL